MVVVLISTLPIWDSNHSAPLATHWLSPLSTASIPARGDAAADAADRAEGVAQRIDRLEAGAPAGRCRRAAVAVTIGAITT